MMFILFANDFIKYFYVLTDKKQLLESCIKKFPCHKYFTTGRCSFGDLCKYRHINDQEIIELKKEIG